MMQWLDWLNATPLLPTPDVMRWGWPMSWALVLAALAARLGQRLPVRWRVVLVLIVLGWTLWPGLVSPAYWLGLAFQSPSLTSTVLCGAWLVQRGLVSPSMQRRFEPSHAQLWFCAAGAILGWVLLGDTLGWWQPSVYAWGFGVAALGLVAVVLSLLWLAAAPDRRKLALTRLLALTLLLFVITRLPSGNLWDALLDPWLWLLLQWIVLRALWRRARQ